MNKNILLGLLAASLVFACREGEELTYRSHDNIYFDFSEQEGDTLSLYSFAYNPEKGQDTVYLRVVLSGERMPAARTFRAGIDTRTTTATPGTHYEPLESIYTLPADSGAASIPLIIYNSDKTLEQSSVQVTVKLLPTEDLGTGLPENLTATVRFSNQLEEPDWWSNWESTLGDYSRVKYALYLIAVGNVDLLTSEEMSGEGGFAIPYNLYIVEKFRQFLADPFTWQAANEQGYVLEETPEGDYDFYTELNPHKVYLLEKNEGDGKYYFIDENDEPVILN